MNKVEEIEQNLSKIKALIDKEEQVYESSEIFYGAMGARLGFRKKIEVFRENFSIFCLLKNFFSSNTLNNIEERLRPLLKLYEEFSSSDQNITDKQSTLDEFYKAIDNLPDLRTEEIELPKIITKDDFLKLLDLLEANYGIYFNDDNENFIDKTGLLNSEDVRLKLIEFYNIIRNSHFRSEQSSLSTVATGYVDYFNFLIACSNTKNEIKTELEKLENQRQQKLQEIANLEQKAIDVNYSISSQSNTRIQEVFGSEAEKLEPKIFKLNENITTLFALMLGLLISVALLIAINHDIKIERFYIVYLSTLLVLSAFLTYLIKERTRLIKYQHYCNISFLEIKALSDYTAQLDNKDKIEDLKIQLAYRYFQGPNSQSNPSTDEQDLNVVSSKLNELINMVKDIKSLGEK